VAVLPLSKKDTLTPLAKQIFATLAERYMVDYDETQAIGRRYRRQDEIGTPLCVTVDFDSLVDGEVTIRERDTTEQVRVPIADLEGHIRSRLGF
jgi:glycyl-tRNA synthetase